MADTLLLKMVFDEKYRDFHGKAVMDSNKGTLYSDAASARSDGVADEDVVELTGTVEAINHISAAVRDQRRAKNKKARKSRKKNRKK